MASSTTIKHVATDKSEGITLDELATFIAETELAGIRTNATVKANITWTSKLKSIEVTG